MSLPAYYNSESAITTNANFPDDDGVKWAGGSGNVFAQGTWGGATVQLQFSIDGGTTWSSVPGADVTLTEDDIGAFVLGPCLLRLNVSGGSIHSLRARLTPSAGFGVAID